ncbi:MAG: hypothetical protein RL090_1348 [Bacteroidota bacterium]|jgi:hypothetical protein
MKKLFTISVLALASVNAYAQLPVSQQPALKNAIIEEFTGVNCVYCPDGHKIAAQITAANPGRAFAVNIHTGSFATPSAGQPDFRTPDGNAIAAIPGMGITGYPQGAVSRVPYPSTATALAMSRSAWTAAVNAVLAQPAYVNVAGQAELNASTNQLTINIEAFYTASSPVATNKLTVMLLQNNVNGPQTGASQFNPTMVNPDGTYRHMHALRDVITTGSTGEDITNTAQGTLVQRTFNYTVPATIGTVPVDVSNLEILVFVAQSTTNIINVARVPIAYTGLTTVNNANLVSVAQPDDLCDANFAPSIQLKNLGSAPITSAVIDYNVNGGTNWTYYYYGNIGPLGTANITLPAIVGFQMNPSNTLNVNVSSVNGGSDDDPSNNSSSTPFNATTSASQTLNLTLNVLQDRYGDEITWKFFNGGGTQIAAGGPYTQLAANGTQLNTHQITLPATGCYRFVIYDSYGDGINSGYGVGNVTILDGNSNTVYFNNGIYSAQAARNFYGNTSLGLNDASLESSLNIFPNPVSNSATVQFQLTSEETVSINVLNAVGQSVLQQNFGKLAASQTYNQSLDMSALSNGLYFMEIKAGNSTITRKFSVSK